MTTKYVKRCTSRQTRVIHAFIPIRIDVCGAGLCMNLESKALCLQLPCFPANVWTRLFSILRKTYHDYQTWVKFYLQNFFFFSHRRVGIHHPLQLFHCWMKALISSSDNFFFLLNLSDFTKSGKKISQTLCFNWLDYESLITYRLG